MDGVLNRLVLFLILVVPLAVQAQFTFTTNNGAITITGYAGAGGVVVIPSTTNGLPVTSIGRLAFQGCNLTSVTIPDTVTSIEYGAFYGCYALSSVTLGSNVTDIGVLAFYGCRNLAKITIPSSVTSIGRTIFFLCNNLKAITVDSSNSVYSSVNGVLFNRSQTTLIQCPEGITGTYTIPGGTTSIGEEAFTYCALTNVIIPSSNVLRDWVG